MLDFSWFSGVQSLQIWVGLGGFRASKDDLLRADHAPNAMEVHRAAQGFDPLALVVAVGLVVLQWQWDVRFPCPAIGDWGDDVIYCTGWWLTYPSEKYESQLG